MKKLAIVLAALLLASVFVGCGAVGEKALLGKWDVVSFNGKTDLTTTPYRINCVRYVFEENNVGKFYSVTSPEMLNDGTNALNRKWALDEAGTTLTITYGENNLDGEYTVEFGLNQMTWTQTRPEGSKGDIIVLKKVTE